MSIQRFVDLANSWAPYMRYSSKTAVALREGNEWVLRYAFTVVSFEEIPTAPVNIETRSLLVIREAPAIPADQSVKAIEDMISVPASITVTGRTLSLGGSGQPHSSYHGLYLPRFPGPRRLPSITTGKPSDGTAPNSIDLLDLDLELRACSAPYESLVELISDMGLPLQPQDVVYNMRTEITLAPPAEVKNFDICDGVLSFHVICSPQIDRNAMTIGLKLLSSVEQKIDRAPFSGGQSFEEVGQTLKISCSQSVENIGLAEVFLNYHGESLGAWWVRDNTLAFNKKTALHKAIDPGNVFVSQFFEDRKSFEERVSLLLTFMNLDCLFYGRIAELTDGPDILARSSQDHLYVVECTTGDINQKGKLRRLYERTNAIRASLENSPHKPREILAVMITSLWRAETVHCWDELKALQISLVAREQVQNLLNQIEAPPAPDRLYASALEAIPGATLIEGGG